MAMTETRTAPVRRGVPSAPTTKPVLPMEALLDRKIKLMERLNCHDLFEELVKTDDELNLYLGQQIDFQARLRARKAEVEDLEALAALNVEGKNPEERKARKTEALKGDGAYQDALKGLRENEAGLANTEAQMEAVKRRLRAIERRIDYQVSILRFLGG